MKLTEKDNFIVHLVIRSLFNKKASLFLSLIFQKLMMHERVSAKKKISFKSLRESDSTNCNHKNWDILHIYSRTDIAEKMFEKETILKINRKSTKHERNNCIFVMCDINIKEIKPLYARSGKSRRIAWNNLVY